MPVDTRLSPTRRGCCGSRARGTRQTTHLTSDPHGRLACQLQSSLSLVGCTIGCRREARIDGMLFRSFVRNSINATTDMPKRNRPEPRDPGRGTALGVGTMRRIARHSTCHSCNMPDASCVPVALLRPCGLTAWQVSRQAKTSGLVCGGLQLRLVTRFCRLYSAKAFWKSLGLLAPAR